MSTRRWLALLAGSIATLAAGVVGLAGLMFTALALNGFSERQALPWFAAYLFVASSVHAALVALITWLVVRRDPGRQTLFTVGATLGYTLLPYLVAAAVLLAGRLRARG
jgi:hypothetical protein